MNAKLMRWHKEERKHDNMLRHPADGSQWRKVDRTFPTFANDVRNIRFGLSMDGMNPFGEQSSAHSTWPVEATGQVEAEIPVAPVLTPFQHGKPFVTEEEKKKSRHADVQFA